MKSNEFNELFNNKKYLYLRELNAKRFKYNTN